MAIQYNPKDAVSCIPDGEYQATLMEIEETESKSSGSPMYKLKWKVYGDNGAEAHVYDYIVMTEKGVWKLRKLADAFGMRAAFDSATFDPNMLEGENCRLNIGIEEGEGDFPDRNRVASYVKDSGSAPDRANARTVPASKASIEDADIPF